MDLYETCAEAQDGELDGLWTTITIFITLFLLSVCYSATVTLFKVGTLSPHWSLCSLSQCLHDVHTVPTIPNAFHPCPLSHAALTMT
jgi:hypothetical protein